jgi:hypothetical protein
MPSYSFAFGEYIVRRASITVDAAEPGQALSKARAMLRSNCDQALRYEYDEAGAAAYFLDMIGPDGRLVELGELPACHDDQIFHANCETARRYNASESLVTALQGLLLAASGMSGVPFTQEFTDALERGRQACKDATGARPLSLVETAEVPDDEERLFINHYRCDECDESWTDTWSATCDDRCPACNRAISPHHSDDLVE